MNASTWLARKWNGLRKLFAGLTPGGENLWPGVRSDLFLAHLSIYRFATGHVRGQRVLDAGSGAGYGSAESPFASRASLDLFEFIPSDRDEFYSEISLTGIYVLSRKGA